MSENLTAHVSRDALLSAIEQKIAAVEAERDKLSQQYKDEIDELVAQKPKKGILWWRRLKTRREIEYDYTDEPWDGGYWLSVSITRKGGVISRYKEMYSLIEKDSVTNVRLSEDALLELKDYL